MQPRRGGTLLVEEFGGQPQRFVDRARQQRVKDVVLGGEVVIQRGLPHADRVGDPTRRRAGVAEVGEQLRRRVEDLFARGLARPPRLLQPWASTAVAAHGSILAPSVAYSRKRRRGRRAMSADWMEREVAHSRRVIANAKLVVTFTAALAATFVAQFMDKMEKERGGWDIAALIFMWLTLVLTVWVVLLRHKPHEGELKLWVFNDAKKTANRAHLLMVTQVVLALL